MRLKARIRLAQCRWHQYWCRHHERVTKTWLQDKAIHRKTHCTNCGKRVIALASMPNIKVHSLLNVAASLAAGERLDV